MADCGNWTGFTAAPGSWTDWDACQEVPPIDTPASVIPPGLTDVSGTENDTGTIPTAYAFDLGSGTVVQYSAMNLPSDALIDSLTGIITYDLDTPGTVNTTVTLQTTVAPTSSDTFQWTVIPDVPPVTVDSWATESNGVWKTESDDNWILEDGTAPPPVELPVFTTDINSSYDLFVGDGLILTVDATLADRFEWFLNGVATGSLTKSTPIDDSVAAVFTIFNRATITSTGLFTDSTTALVTVTARTAATITQNPPATQSLNDGDTLNIFAQATGDLPYTWKWFKNSVEIPGQTTNNLNVQVFSADDGASYEAEVDNAYGVPDRSTPCVITISSSGTAPTWTQDLDPQYVAMTGNSLQITVAADGVPAPDYQWFKEGIAIGNAQIDTLFLNTSVPRTNDYYCTADNGVGGGPIQSVTTTILINDSTFNLFDNNAGAWTSNGSWVYNGDGTWTCTNPTNVSSLFQRFNLSTAADYAMTLTWLNNTWTSGGPWRFVIGDVYDSVDVNTSNNTVQRVIRPLIATGNCGFVVFPGTGSVTVRTDNAILWTS